MILCLSWNGQDPPCKKLFVRVFWLQGGVARHVQKTRCGTHALVHAAHRQVPGIVVCHGVGAGSGCLWPLRWCYPGPGCRQHGGVVSNVATPWPGGSHAGPSTCVAWWLTCVARPPVEEHGDSTLTHASVEEACTNRGCCRYGPMALNMTAHVAGAHVRGCIPSLYEHAGLRACACSRVAMLPTSACPHPPLFVPALVWGLDNRVSWPPYG